MLLSWFRDLSDQFPHGALNPKVRFHLAAQRPIIERGMTAVVLFLPLNIGSH